MPLRGVHFLLFRSCFVDLLTRSHLKVFANTDAAEEWFRDNNSEDAPEDFRGFAVRSMIRADGELDVPAG